jgi:hypothetical protein
MELAISGPKPETTSNEDEEEIENNVIWNVSLKNTN